MLFNSIQFLLFFIVVTPAYYLTPQRWRWLLLLLASCYFYASFIPAYLLILFAIILIDYAAGLLMENAPNPRRKAFLAMSLTANIGVLAIFKYYNFFVGNIDHLLRLAHIHTHPFPLWQFALPIGLSFHTFQAMSYTVEVYRGRQKAEKRLGIYALYVMFYPQLVAGPIERPGELLHQFDEPHRPDFDLISAGLKKMLLGMFLKVVVADRLAIFINYVYAHPGLHGRLALLTAVVFYSFQIYCDFAGYSLIAIGSAQTMGFRLADNFRQPYLASSMRAFWGRWHMTLSRWFRDYVYIPLGGGRTGAARHVFNILVVFLLSGLWHGAGWTFIAWGLLHGLLVIAELYLPRLRLGGPLYCFTAATLCWIFFRASTLTDAFTVFGRIFDPRTPWRIPGEFEERATLVYSLFGIGCVAAMDVHNEYFHEKRFFFNDNKGSVRIATAILLVILILMAGVFDGGQFIYFQF
jgi:alginate O-acetyltransferase complex protein AlgI